MLDKTPTTSQATGELASKNAASLPTDSAEQLLPGQKQRWFAGLDSIRFLLAFVVVLSHFQSPITTSMRHSSSAYLRPLGMLVNVSCTGIAAVIAFFIISGFVIHYPNKAGISSKASFYSKRLIRVLIPLVIISLLGIPFGNPEKAVVWSLYCELIYYIIYPALVAAPTSWRTKLLVSFAVSGLLILTVGLHEVLSLLTQSDRNYHGEFWQFGIGLTWIIGLPCWLLGVNLAERIDNQRQAVSTKRILLIRAAIISLTIGAQIAKFHFYFSYIIAFTLLAFPIMKWLEIEIVYYKSNAPLPFLEKWGKFSYSLYLCHPLILAVLAVTLPLTSYTYFPYLFSCLAFSYGFYLILEKPAHLLAARMSMRFSKPALSRQLIQANPS
ncbi:hypothetical protein GO988_20110 [Hymenobacter sp. HMF4947]|uniref:Acyltransferase 3 domain-containing protein n=1 Tax=Hymenobacter ginkgonis TaxID=2682976 RepID=A0A7K1TJS3_9BACT|nr:acyltransferase [Hymenobacter ginkgonis]MVN78644.1 hypothetical protein [Hymenobacter ginkgonis]